MFVYKLVYRAYYGLPEECRRRDRDSPLLPQQQNCPTVGISVRRWTHFLLLSMAPQEQGPYEEGRDLSRILIPY